VAQREKHRKVTQTGLGHEADRGGSSSTSGLSLLSGSPGRSSSDARKHVTPHPGRRSPGVGRALAGYSVVDVLRLAQASADPSARRRADEELTAEIVEIHMVPMPLGFGVCWWVAGAAGEITRDMA
jgi:hypothetical protein